MNMQRRFYLDTSIWLDFFENRDEPNLPKGTWAKALIKNAIANNNIIIVSEVVKNELLVQGYSRYELEYLFLPLKKILHHVYSTQKQFGRAKDLAKKRDIPLFDALHALLARDHRALLITLDHHFQQLADIVKPHHPQEFI